MTFVNLFKILYFVQDSFTIPGFQDRVRELQEETGGRGFSDESGGGKYFTLTISTSLFFYYLRI